LNFVRNVVKIDPYSFELCRFKVSAFLRYSEYVRLFVCSDVKRGQNIEAEAEAEAKNNYEKQIKFWPRATLASRT